MGDVQVVKGGREREREGKTGFCMLGKKHHRTMRKSGGYKLCSVPFHTDPKGNDELTGSFICELDLNLKMK